MHGPESSLTRRELLGLVGRVGGGVALLGGIPALAAACGGGSPAPAASAPGRAHLNLQLAYLENVQFGGSFVADDSGAYRGQNVEVSFLPGGSNLAVEPIVASGKALIGITHTSEFAQAITNGARLQVIGAGYQKNPFCLISRTEKPISVPTDVIGKRVGVADANQPIWNAFLKANGIDASKVTTVTVQFDPTPLASGSVDGYLGFFTNEPIQLQLQGVNVQTMLMNDHGYPLLEELYIVRADSLADKSKRAVITSFMRAERQGWAQAMADPGHAAVLAVSKYGTGLKLDLKQQTLEAQAQNQLVADSDTSGKGLFWMSDGKVASTRHSLALGGIDIPASTFTTAVLAEL